MNLYDVKVSEEMEKNQEGCLELLNMEDNIITDKYTSLDIAFNLL